MSKAGKKPRKKMDARQVDNPQPREAKNERDWSFEDIARSKTRRR